MTKKLPLEVKDARANLRMGKEAIREVNDRAEKLINNSNVPHEEALLKHELTGLAAIHAGL